jgi:PAS domain S-box-containing protein
MSRSQPPLLPAPAPGHAGPVASGAVHLQERGADDGTADLRTATDAGAEPATDRQRGGRHGRLWRPLIAALAVLAVTALAAWAVRTSERAANERNSSAVEDRVIGALSMARPTGNAAAVTGGASLLPDGSFSPAEFARVAPTMLEQTGATTVSWVEVVTPEEQADWERRRGIPLTRFDPATGERVPVAPADRWFVVAGVEPDEPEFTRTRGLDLSSDPIIGGPLGAALLTGEPQFTQPLQLADGSGDIGFVVVVPVTSGGEVAGVVAATYRGAGLLRDVDDEIGVRVTDGDEVLTQRGNVGADAPVRQIPAAGRIWDVAVDAPVPAERWGLVLAVGGLAAFLAFLVVRRVEREAAERRWLEASERSARDRAESAVSALASSEQRFRTLLLATSKIVWTTGPDGAMDRSPSWERFTGQRPEDYVGPTYGGFEALHPDDRSRIRALWQDTIRFGVRFETTYRLRRADGEYRRVEVSGVPVRGDDGEVREWVGSCNDVEEELRAREELAAQSMLTETITENASSALFLMDEQGCPTYVNSAAVEMFGWTLQELRGRPLHDTVHHTRPDGSPYPIAECPIDRALPERRWIEPYEDLFIRRDGSFVQVRAAASPIMREGRPVGTVVEVQDVTAEQELLSKERNARQRAQLLERSATRLAAAATLAEVARATLADLPAVGVRTGQVELDGLTGPTVLASIGAPGTDDEELSVPLRTADGDKLGRLQLSGATGWLVDELRPLLTGVAEQTALALERALLQAELATASERTLFLAQLSDVLDQGLTVAERATLATDLMEERWGVPTTILLLAEDKSLEFLGASRPQPGADRSAVVRLLRAGIDGPTVLERTGTDRGPTVVVPVLGRVRLLGALVYEQPEGVHPFDGALATDVAARLGIALDNAHLYEQERHVSHTLQEGLLSGALTPVEGILLTAAYRPGTETLEVGGDWYDVFHLDGGSIALLVGDVVGHGLEAAIAMGQLRGAVRALAPGSDPASLLERLDAFVESLPAAGMATVAYVEFALETGAFRYACAGHPPPLVVGVDGRTRLLWNGRSAPLGCAAPGTRTHGSGALREGESVLLYSDGLVERRSRGIDEGLEILAATAERLAPVDEAFADRVADRMLAASPHDDDACVLGAQYLPTAEVFSHAMVAAPSELSGLRHDIGPWLARIGVDELTAQSVVLAVSEAAANAMEHGYAFDAAGVTTVTAVFDAAGDRELRITVRDRGLWREPPVETDRGRGQGIIESIMDGVQVDRDPEGTTVRMYLSLREATVV